MKIGLIGYNKSPLLRRLSDAVNAADHTVETFILSQIPSNYSFEISKSTLLLNGHDLNEFDIFYIDNYHFFWPYLRFNDESPDNWNKIKDEVPDQLINFRESESIRSSFIYILNNQKKLINSIEFFLLFEFKLHLFMLLEKFNIPVIPFRIKLNELKKIKKRREFLQDYLSQTTIDLFYKDNEKELRERINSKKFPKVIKEIDEEKIYSFYLYGDKIDFPDTDIFLENLSNLENIRNFFLEYLQNLRFFCRFDFTVITGQFYVVDIIPSPELKHQKDLENLTNFIIKGGSK